MSQHLARAVANSLSVTSLSRVLLSMEKLQYIPAMDREMCLRWAKIKGTQRTEKKGVAWGG